jgi:hypothetical protein
MIYAVAASEIIVVGTPSFSNSRAVTYLAPNRAPNNGNMYELDRIMNRPGQIPTPFGDNYAEILAFTRRGNQDTDNAATLSVRQNHFSIAYKAVAILRYSQSAICGNRGHPNKLQKRRLQTQRHFGKELSSFDDRCFALLEILNIPNCKDETAVVSYGNINRSTSNVVRKQVAASSQGYAGRIALLEFISCSTQLDLQAHHRGSCSSLDKKCQRLNRGYSHSNIWILCIQR